MRLKDIIQKEDFKILVVDDEQGIIDSLAIFLNQYHFVGVTDPLEAIEKVRNEHFDLMILDFLMMPIHGDKVVEEIRKFNKDLYILLLTGHKDLAPPLETIKRLDIQGYCEKSDKFDQILLLVESGLKSVSQMRVIKEINDKHQKYDVKHNIDVLINTNKYYQQFCETEELNKFAESFASESTLVTDDDFAPIKLSKEQEENMRGVKKEVIGLSGQFDKDAYNEMFEYSDKKKDRDEKEQEENKKEDEELKQKLDEQKLDQERKGFQDSLDYVKDLLGMNEVVGKTAENIEKEK
jgi:DNA-binding NarL/FixJ family response regulator